MSDDGYDDGGDSHYSEPEPSYHEPSPEPSYHHPSPEPSYHEPSIREPSPVPSYRAPSPPEPSYHEPSIRESSLEDPPIREPSIRDPRVRERSIHSQSVHDSEGLNPHHDPPLHPQAQHDDTPSNATEKYRYSYNSASDNDSTRRISHDRESRQSDHSNYFGSNDGYLARNISGPLDQDQLRLRDIALMYPTSRICLSGDSVSRASSACGDEQSRAHGQNWDPEGHDRDYSRIGNLRVHNGTGNRQADDRPSEDGDSDIELENYEAPSVGNMVVTHGCSAVAQAIQTHGGQSHSDHAGNHSGDHGNQDRPAQRPCHKEQHHQIQRRHPRPHHAPNPQPPSIPLPNPLRPSPPAHPANSPTTLPPRKFTHPTSPMVSKVTSPYHPTTTEIQKLDTPSTATTAVESAQGGVKYKRKRGALFVRACAVIVFLVCVVLVIVLPIVYTSKS